MDKQCSNCEFNMNRICVGNSNVYHYGETIVDDTNFCEGWGADLKYFTEQIVLAPRFLRDAYNDCKIDYEKLEEAIIAEGMTIKNFDIAENIKNQELELNYIVKSASNVDIEKLIRNISKLGDLEKYSFKIK